MFEIGQDIGKVAVQGFGRGHDGIQAGVCCPEVPASKNPLRSFGAGKTLQATERLFDCPRTPCLQMSPPDRVEFVSAPLGNVFFVAKPKMLGPFQPVVAHGTQPLVFAPSNLVDSLGNGPYNMELVKNDLACGVRNVTLGSRDVRVPHVHGNRLGAAQIFAGEMAKVLPKAFLLPIVGYELDRPGFAVKNKSFVPVRLGKCFLVDVQPGWDPSFFAGQPAGHSLLHDMPRFVPTRPGHTLCPRDVAFLEGVDHSALKKIRERQSGTGPSRLDLTHPVRGALYPWQARVDIGQAVTRV